MSPTPHFHPVRVYWEDTDAGGIVYHASYVRFFERGRTELLRDLGVAQSATADRTAAGALLFTVRRMTVDYLRPAVLDDLLAVETAVVAAAGARIEMAQRITRDGTELARAAVTVAAIGGDGRPRRLPEALQRLFLPPG